MAEFIVEFAGFLTNHTRQTTITALPQGPGWLFDDRKALTSRGALKEAALPRLQGAEDQAIAACGVGNKFNIGKIGKIICNGGVGNEFLHGLVDRRDADYFLLKEERHSLAFWSEGRQLDQNSTYRFSASRDSFSGCGNLLEASLSRSRRGLGKIPKGDHEDNKAVGDFHLHDSGSDDGASTDPFPQKVPLMNVEELQKRLTAYQ
jgi:hypothetical protein